MKTSIRKLQVVVFLLAILSLLIIIGDSIIINVYTAEMAFDPNTISGWETMIMIGTVLLGIFFLASMYWMSQLEGDKGRFSPGKIATMVFGAVCVFLLLGEKAVANQIGEYMLSQQDVEVLMGRLQLMFILQLVYVLLIMVEMAAQDKPERTYEEMAHSRDVIAATSSIIPGLGHIYKAHYTTGFGILALSPFLIWMGLMLGWATFGLGLFLPGLYVFLIGWHAYNLEDRRKHPAGVL